MEAAALTVIILGTFLGSTSGAGVLPDTLNAAVGGSLNFTTTLSQTEKPFISISWKFGERNIITSEVFNNTGAGYNNRITLFPSTGSLELRNLVLTDSGEYRVVIIPNGEPVTRGSTRLQVYQPVFNVQTTVSGTDLVEFQSQVTFTCSATAGSALYFSWLNGSSHVTASDRVQLTDGGKTFTIKNVTRYDNQPFACVASNSISTETSPQTNLSVSFGPENTNLRLSPPQEYFNEGSNISLLCSADSRPAALFKWFYNGVELPDTGPELSLTHVMMNQSGNFSCRASNSRTEMNQESQSLHVTVLERISDVFVTSSTNQAIEGDSVNLTCEAAGSVFTKEWMKDGLDLTLTDNMNFYDENRVLSFQPVTRNESGEYSCKVSNPLTNKEAMLVLIINYGPENVQIKGPSEINVGQSFTLTCSAESTPHADFTWIWNGTEIYNFPEFIHNNTELSDSGNYTCAATNRITRITSLTDHHITVTENTTGLSVGAIAGIVIACLAVVSAVAVGGFFIFRKVSSKPKPKTKPLSTSSVQLQPRQQTVTQEDHIYEDLSIYENA